MFQFGGTRQWRYKLMIDTNGHVGVAVYAYIENPMVIDCSSSWLAAIHNHESQISNKPTVYFSPSHRFVIGEVVTFTISDTLTKREISSLVIFTVFMEMYHHHSQVYFKYDTLQFSKFTREIEVESNSTIYPLRQLRHNDCVRFQKHQRSRIGMSPIYDTNECDANTFS